MHGGRYRRRLSPSFQVIDWTEQQRAVGCGTRVYIKGTGHTRFSCCCNAALTKAHRGRWHRGQSPGLTPRQLTADKGQSPFHGQSVAFQQMVLGQQDLHAQRNSSSHACKQPHPNCKEHVRRPLGSRLGVILVQNPRSVIHRALHHNWKHLLLKKRLVECGTHM